MKAVVTSIGEVTQDLCIWSLERGGFDVDVIEDGTTLAQKLKRIYSQYDEDFVRIDADVVLNKTFTAEYIERINYYDAAGAGRGMGESRALVDAWWIQFRTFGWFKQDMIHGGAQLIRKEALPALRKNIDRFQRAARPETSLSRIPEFYEPRRFMSVEGCVGVHGFAARDGERIKQIKRLRNQYDTYDWELAEKLLELAR